MKVDTIISNAYLVNVPSLEIEVIYGVIEEDFKGRFIEGDYVCSGAIVSKNTDTNTFTTRNSVYVATGDVQSIIVSINEYKLIIQGVEPIEAVLLSASTEVSKKVKH